MLKDELFMKVMILISVILLKLGERQIGEGVGEKGDRHGPGVYMISLVART